MMDTDLQPQASRRKAKHDKVLTSNLPDSMMSAKSSATQCDNFKLVATSKPTKTSKDKSRCKATPITIPPAQAQRSTPIPCPERKPRQLKSPTTNRLGNESTTDVTGTVDSGQGQGNRSSSRSPSEVCVKIFPAPSKKDTFPSPVSLSPSSELHPPTARANDSSRSTSLSPKTRAASLSPLDPHRGRRINSPTPGSRTGTSSNSGRSLSLSPNTISQEPFSFPTHHQHPKPYSAPLCPSLSLNSRALVESMGPSELDIPHPPSSPPRDIFSPIPCERVIDEGQGVVVEPELTHGPTNDGVDIDSFADGGSNFPAIKVEDCDDGDGASSRIHGPNANDSSNIYGPVRKSATVPNYTTITEWGGVGEKSSKNMTSLNVPSPFVRRRTTDGRLIVGMNNTLTLAGALSKMWSRSEGSIPFIIEDHETKRGAKTFAEGADEPAYNDRASASSSRSSSRSSTTWASQRLAKHDDNADISQSTRRPNFRSNSASRRELLSPTLREDLVSSPTFRMSPEPSLDDIKRNIHFLSPQPKRRLGPRY